MKLIKQKYYFKHTIFPWMLCKMELCTQPRDSVHKENCLRALRRSSTSTTVGLNTKILMSKFLLLKGTKHAINSSLSLFFFSLLAFSVCMCENNQKQKTGNFDERVWESCGLIKYRVVGKLEKWNLIKGSLQFAWFSSFGLCWSGERETSNKTK